MSKSMKARAVDRFVGESDDEQAGTTERIGLDHRSQVWISFRQSGAVMGIYDREYYRGETGGTGLVQRRLAGLASPSS